MQPICQTPAPGLRVLSMADDRFKTARVTAALLLPLREETASAYAVLPFLLRRGCAAYPDFTALKRRLNQLYGARITADVARVGESQALVLTAVSLDSRFALQGEDVAAQCASLLCSMLFEPALENGLFRADDVEQEKRCLLELIQSEINEKRWYARHQCERLLCEGEPYAVNRYGTPEGAEALTPASVTAAWKEALRTARVQLMVQGSGDAAAVADAFRRGFAAVPGREPMTPELLTRFEAQAAPRTRTDRLAVNQSKLVLGFRTTETEGAGDVAAMRLMNALWGGTPHSLLFQNVREKKSLCYYCASSYDRQKGVLLVDSGVEEDKAAEAREEILRQLEAVRQGRFTPEELESARLSVVNQLRTVGDLQQTLAAWYLGQAAQETLTTPEEAAAAVEQVDKARVCAAAETVAFQCVYMLASNGSEEGNHGHE